MIQEQPANKGQCLCGDIQFSISESPRNIIVCHCKQCHQWHGQAAFYSQAKLKHITFTKSASLKWYRSSDHAERGFCISCGSSMFWRPNNGDRISVAAGCLSTTEELSVVAHIYCEGHPKYDVMDTNLPCYADTSAGKLDPL